MASGWPDGKPDWGSYEDRWGPDDRPPSTYSARDAELDLAVYQSLKRTVSLGALAGVPVGLVMAMWLPMPGLALAAGAVCGIANALLTMRGNERLLDNRAVGGFVLAGFARMALFALPPVYFAMHGPWWSMLCYFGGFFVPLALYFALVGRAFARKGSEAARIVEDSHGTGRS